MISRLDLIALATFAGLLFVTRPSEADVEAKIKGLIIADITAAQLSQESDFLSNFLTLTCKFDAERCYRLTRAAMEVSYRDAALFSAVTIGSSGRQRNCVGAFKRLFCPSFLN